MLVDDVLVQLQELTDIVGDLAELARGDRGPAPREPLRLDLLVQDEVAVQNTHGRAKDVRFELDAEPCWVVASDDGPPPGRGQPARQRPQVEPAGRAGRGGVPRRARSSCTTTARASPRRTCPTSSTASTARRRPAGCRARASAWPSSPRSSRPRAGRSWPRTTPAAGPACRMRLPTVAGPVEAGPADAPSTSPAPASATAPRRFLRAALRERQSAAKVRRAHWCSYPRWSEFPLPPRRGVPLPPPARRWGRSAAVPAGVSSLHRRTGRPARPTVRGPQPPGSGDELDPVAERVVDVGARARGPRRDSAAPPPRRPAGPPRGRAGRGPPGPGGPCGPDGSPPRRRGAPPPARRRTSSRPAPPAARAWARGPGRGAPSRRPRLGLPPGGMASCTWSSRTISKPIGCLLTPGPTWQSTPGTASLPHDMGSLIKKRRKRMRKKKHKKMLKATRWQRRAGK